MTKNLTLLTAILLTVLYTSAQITDTITPTPSTSKYVYVYDLSPTAGYPNLAQISAGYNSVGGVYTQSRTYIYFDLTSIPASAIVTSAYLNLHFDSLINPTTYSGSPGQNGTLLSMVNQSWNLDSVTWNNQPNVSTTDTVIVGPTAGIRTDITNINVSTPVQTWIANPGQNYGWRFWQISEYAVQESQEDFASSFDTLRPDKMPTLVVTYSFPAGVGNISSEPVISIYPNPANNTLMLQGVTTENFAVCITDMLGRKADFEISGKEINTTNLASGSYILRYTDLDTQKTVSRKFVKL